MELNYTEGEEIMGQFTKNLQVQSSTSLKPSCRICLYEGKCQQGEENSLISPCDCKGSLQLVHESCLGSWIQRKITSKSAADFDVAKIKCEICKALIQFEVKRETKFGSCINIKERLAKNNIVSCMALVLLILLLTFAIFMAVLLVKNETINEIFLIVMTGISWVLLIFYVLLLTKVFVLEKNIKSIEIKEKGRRR